MICSKFVRTWYVTVNIYFFCVALSICCYASAIGRAVFLIIKSKYLIIIFNYYLV